MLGFFAALFFTPTLVPAQLPPSGLQINLKKQISAYSKPAVVRVVAGCSGTYSYSRNEFSSNEVSLSIGEIGSGYFVDPDGYIVTNAHVLRSAEEAGCREQLFKRLVLFVTGQENFDKVPEETKRDLGNRSRLKGDIDYINRVILPTGASLPFDIKQSGTAKGGTREDVGVIKINVNNAPTLKLGESGKVEPQASVVVVGYPLDPAFKSLSTSSSSEDLSSLPFLKDLSLGKSLGGATVLDGWAAKFNQKSDSDLPVLQFNDVLPTGISGSPVLNEKSEVLGMITIDEKAAQDGSTSALVIPATTVRELVNRAGGKNEQSSTDKLYREGLSLFSQGNFKDAKAKFEAVQKLFPYHSEAGALIGATDQKIAEAQQKRSGILWLLGAGAAAGLVAVVYTLTRPGYRRKQIFRSLLKKLPTRQGSPPESAKVLPTPPVKGIGQPETRKPAAVTQIGGNAFSPPTVIGTQPFIDLKNQDGQVRRFYLRRERHQLGRDRDWADLYIPDGGWEVISRHHAVLEREGADYRIYDGDRQTPSTNGIFVNGTPVSTHEGHLLKDGDQVVTGDDPRNQMILTYSHPGGNSIAPARSQINSTRELE